ncbi:hypothetical protein [Pseudoclavibacter helvolus]|uniref:hypothetical protein n=1 Tax=Pseudoclavibacter helvolus TaxID=255205 RepID=UPI00083973CC|nr:hypothetical protein [Pseudoclavibacter helvolus]
MRPANAGGLRRNETKNRITLAIPFTLPAPRVSWRQADDDVYAATISDEFAGFITIADTGLHTLQGPQGQSIGDYGTLDEAQEALAEALFPVEHDQSDVAAARPRRRRTGRRGPVNARIAS